ncbi:RES family NAD+ phosphorylase [Deinococcus saxicola]|uniref:RES family NAD+ phosphorylase n=1 Tax=Deinococcus saxicola TaxID=249406 RepID=UPI0039F0502A
MIAYRLAHKNALLARPDSLTTAGGEARWNSGGVFVTYLAEHVALAALEMLNYAGIYRQMNGYELIKVDVDGRSIETVDPVVDVRDHAQTRPYGDAWVQSGRSLGLRVPSVTGPESWNLLLDQRHPEFGALKPVRLGAFTFDPQVTDLLK